MGLGLRLGWTVSDLNFPPAYILPRIIFELHYFLIMLHDGNQFDSLIFLSYCHQR